jgi:uncharacterized Ntn-hydrolase superfamily protein
MTQQENNTIEKMVDAAVAVIDDPRYLLGKKHTVIKIALKAALEAANILILDKDAEPEIGDIGIDKHGELGKYEYFTPSYGGQALVEWVAVNEHAGFNEDSSRIIHRPNYSAVIHKTGE